MINKTSIIKQTMSYAKRTGLRSMQNIKGDEREIIEAYRNELTHDIWGDEQKLKKWIINKINQLTKKDYSSDLLDEEGNRIRKEGVRSWIQIIENKGSVLCNSLFTKLKIIKFITDNLRNDNKATPPPINQKVINDTLSEIKRTGASFKKTYYKLLREFDSKVNVKTENVFENGIKGKWYSLRVPNEAEAKNNLGLFNRIKDYIRVLSEGSNWCTRTPKAITRDFMGCDFYIFVDNKGIPQLCLTKMRGNETQFRFIRGKNQYEPIPEKYKPILKSFLKRHNLNDSLIEQVNDTKVEL